MQTSNPRLSEESRKEEPCIKTTLFLFRNLTFESKASIPTMLVSMFGVVE